MYDVFLYRSYWSCDKNLHLLRLFDLNSLHLMSVISLFNYNVKCLLSLRSFILMFLSLYSYYDIFRMIQFYYEMQFFYLFLIADLDIAL